MRKLLIRALAVAAALALIVAASALAKPHTIRAGNLFLTDNGGITPSKLPRHTQTPVTARIAATIGTDDGTHPPAVQDVEIDFDKSILVNAKGLPACKEGRLEARTTADAKQACPDSIVGTGEGDVEVAFAESRPFTARGPIVLFSGGVHGGTTRLFAHAYVSVPAPTAVIVPVEISRINRGHYGLHSVTEVPPIAGGAGSVIDFKLKIGRSFDYRGSKRSYLTASCPSGRYYTEGHIHFADGSELQGVHILPCTPAP